MAQHNILGVRGEQMAVDFLLKHNYVITDRNWRFRKYEIDIIAEFNNTLIFIEVKTRNTINQNIAELFSLAKQKQILNALHEYCLKNNVVKNAQIDAIVIDIKNNEIQHLKDFIRY